MNLFGRMLVKLGADANGFASYGPDEDYWYKPREISTWSGAAVNERTALRSSAVYACVQVIAQTVASLPFKVYRQSGEGNRREDPSHPLYAVLHEQANAEMTAFEFWEMSTAHLLTWGNSFARIDYDAKLNVQALHPLDPARMQVKRDGETGVRYYEYAEGSGKAEILVSDEVLHLPGLGYDGLRGYSPVQMMCQAIGLSLSAEEYGSRFFQNAGPERYIAYPKVLNDVGRANILNWFLRNFGGVRNAHKLGILEEGAEIKTVPVNHRDIQFLELRKFQIEEIARIYRVPPHMIQDLSRSTNNNIEHQGIDFATHTIRPWVERIEQRVNMSLLGPRERQQYTAEMSMDALMRGDAKSRAEYYSKRFSVGSLSPNEIRALENENPYAGGDEYWVQGAYVPVSVAVKGQQKAQVAE